MIFTPPEISPPCVSRAFYAALSGYVQLAELRAHALDALFGWAA